MFCSRCGLRVDEGVRFCKACGQEVGAVSGGGSATMGTPQVPAAQSASASVPLPFAGFWVRFVAYVIDSLILSIPLGIIALGLIFAMGGFGILMRLGQANPQDPEAARALAAPIVMVFVFGYLILIVLTWLYFAGMESSDRQATFGKSVMALRVTNLDGGRISFGHATGRFFAKIISGLIPFLIGYIMAAFTARKQALHDLIAGTLVLRR